MEKVMTGLSSEYRFDRSKVRRRIVTTWSRSVLAVCTVFALAIPAPFNAFGGDISVIPWWDGETSVTPHGALINRFGGQPVFGGGALTNVQRTATAARSGGAGYRVNTTSPIPAGGFGFFQTSLTTASSSTSPGRDLTGFEETSFWIRNDTGANFNLKFELKDHRDSAAHRAWRNIPISSASVWQQVHIPLNLSSPGWNIAGSPDLARSRLFGFVFEANQGDAISGAIQFDDFQVRERGGILDSQLSSIAGMAQRVAQRQFQGLWGSRNHVNGLIPVGSANGNSGGLNTTAAMVKMLPTAVSQGWVLQTEANDYVSRVVSTLNTTLNSSNYVPPRYMNLQTLAPTIAEESVVDAAFMALALHQYKNLPTTPVTLSQSIHAVQNRFDFASFSDTQAPTTGWKLAYNTSTQAFTSGTYDGYSSEPWLISLAAHLAETNHVDIGAQYHSAVFRTQDFLTNSTDAHLVHSFDSFRAPFLQWLLPLFVDVADRGADNYPNRTLSSNPLDNAQKYQRDVDAFFAAANRGLLLQPDAGDDGSGTFYQQFSAYNSFGRSDLFMPWSSSFALLGDSPSGEAALRLLLEKSLSGPLGLSDSVRWTTGQSNPNSVLAAHDFWNTSLSTMALLQYLYQDNQLLSNRPEVVDALDQVFYVTWNGVADGDWNSNNWLSGSVPPTNRHDARILSRAVTVTGTQAARRTSVQGGLLRVLGTLQSDVLVGPGGRLAGGGEIDGSLALEGGIRIDQPGATLDVSGNVELGTTSLLEVGSTYSQTRGTTDLFTILTAAGSLQGEFINAVGNEIDSHLGFGFFLNDVIYTNHAATLEIFAALPGDANGDGLVDGSDFGIWNSNKFLPGTTWTRGDFNHDGVTDGADFGIWNANKFLGGPRIVPEPSSPVAMAFLWLFCRNFLPGRKARCSRKIVSFHTLAI
jgi:hypothetical protein